MTARQTSQRPFTQSEVEDLTKHGSTYSKFVSAAPRNLIRALATISLLEQEAREANRLRAIYKTALEEIAKGTDLASMAAQATLDSANPPKPKEERP